MEDLLFGSIKVWLHQYRQRRFIRWHSGCGKLASWKTARCYLSWDAQLKWLLYSLWWDCWCSQLACNRRNRLQTDPTSVRLPLLLSVCVAKRIYCQNQALTSSLANISNGVGLSRKPIERALRLNAADLKDGSKSVVKTSAKWKKSSA